MSRLARVTFEARPAGIAWTLAAGPGGPVRSARTTPTGPNRRVSSCGRSCGGRTWVTPKSTNQPDCGHFRSLDLAVGALGSKLNRALAPVAARRRRDGRPQCANTGRSPTACGTDHIDRSRYGGNAPIAVIYPRAKRSQVIDAPRPTHCAFVSDGFCSRPTATNFFRADGTRKSRSYDPAFLHRDDGLLARLRPPG
jgi:hypothetical protein